MKALIISPTEQSPPNEQSIILNNGLVSNQSESKQHGVIPSPFRAMCIYTTMLPKLVIPFTSENSTQKVRLSLKRWREFKSLLIRFYLNCFLFKFCEDLFWSGLIFRMMPKVLLILALSAVIAAALAGNRLIWKYSM